MYVKRLSTIEKRPDILRNVLKITNISETRFLLGKIDFQIAKIQSMTWDNGDGLTVNTTAHDAIDELHI